MQRSVSKPELSWLENPEIFCVNRLDAHSDHVWYKDEKSFLQQDKTLFQSLDGAWLFQGSACPAQRPAEFFQETYDVSAFDIIEVPGHIELAGYGQIQYINTMYPWDGRSSLRPPQVDMAQNYVGSYVRIFDLDDDLQNRRVCISFGGVEQAFYVWLNGAFVGYSEDSFTPSDFDLTPYLKKKGNRLCVEVYKRSSAAWIEDQDFFRFSGIFRSVYLYAKPALHVEDVWFMAGLAPDNQTGTLKIRMLVSGEGEYTAVFTLKDTAGAVVHSAPIMTATAGDTVQSETLCFANIAAWCHETPTLYTAELRLLDKDGQLCEIVPYSIGFRRFELVNGIMLLNGERIVFRGVNRHEWSALRGRSITPNDMHSDMAAMKRNNFNAVRTSHYPNQSLWYDLCDQNGIYTIDETNLESHGSWQKMGAVEPSWNVPGNLSEWEACVVDRAKSMFERDKNHASVLIWSCGNESYAGTCIRAMADFFRKSDSSRLVHYEGVFHNRAYEDISDIESRMYATPEEVRAYLCTNPAKPFILCEYMHNMGNSLGGMEEYVRLADEFSQYQGGFIWDFKDQALYHTDAYGRRVLGYGGDFGERPTDYAFCGNGVLFADGREKPAMQEVRYWYASKESRARADAENLRRKRDAAAQLDVLKCAQRGKAGALKVVEGDVNLGVYGKGFSVLFSYTEGGPVSYLKEGREWLHAAPRPAFWRAATENDKGSRFDAQSAMWLGADAISKCVQYEVLQKNADQVKISYTYRLPTSPVTTVDIVYTADSSGMLHVHAVYHGQKGLPQMPAFGIRLETHEPVNAVTYQGLSGETYPDRCKGGIFGTYTEHPTAPDYLVPQEYGCRMDTLAICLQKKDAHEQRTSNLSIWSDQTGFAFSAIPYTPMMLEAAQHGEELPQACRTAVTVYGAMRGVGGINSWGADVQPPYHVSAEQDIALSFFLV